MVLNGSIHLVPVVVVGGLAAVTDVGIEPGLVDGAALALGTWLLKM